MTRRDCPVCGRYEPEPVYRQRFAVADDGRRITGYDVVACGGCGAVYADGIPSQDALDGYYAVASKYEYLERGGEAPASLGESHRDMVERLLPLVTDTATRIVDVGCGNGDVLGLLRQAGCTNLLGIDPAEHSATAAHRLHGVEVVAGSVLAMPRSAAAAGLVLLSAVLEHVREVAAALREVAGVLAKDGLLYVEVPDLERFTCDESMPFQQFSVEHINYFTSVSLARAAADAGLRLAETWPALRHTGTLPEPVVCALFQAAPEALEEPGRDHIGPPAARRYVAQSEACEQRVRSRLARLTAAGAPLIIWGAGTYMQHLLAQSPLAEANVVAIVDANPRLHGVVIAGLAVTGPDAIAGRDEPILVGSPAHEREIIAMARRAYGLRSELLSLDCAPATRDRQSPES
jgi:SAM-dependent methyltransferase